ncbi:inorganic phosphate transporter [Chelativorans sp. SCAU2101]|uniref:Phosphate transporter n=1 Tax=Chelativorans petroleitrophicus TaxID=2975484 RepID=A0A9X3B7H0_9HYPH|nr:inorganic phosphate transporter [Chelativorans petroleitrophicus]MCT8991733.1 inorganic phosphate transporter [Chelativorans petroleitrophicus]
MARTADPKKHTLDKDLDKLVHVEEATSTLARGLVAPGLGLLFLALAALLASIVSLGEPRVVIIAVAAAIGAYMALNIGANDVANNVSPAVGAKAMTMAGALVIAAIFESAGALIAGGDVVGTISKGIIAPESVGDPGVFIRTMMAALISSALWVNLATWIGAPVSTTHAVVGGVAGAGIAAAGISAVNWPTMGQIAASWVVSPLMGAIVAALFLAFIKTAIIYQDDKIASARRWVPLLIAVMAGSFTAYLAVKGLGQLVHVNVGMATVLGLGAFAVIWVVSHIHVRRQSEGMENRNQSLRRLFRIPLVISAALLSFAHGANDVANAVGPLAAVVFTVQADTVSAEVVIPLWVMVIGAFGISLGLVLFGPKLIRMVGEQITKLNPMRAFCVALSAAITVIIASALGLPISSTHTAVGAVFGVGFFREWYTAHSKRRRAYLERKGIKVRNARAAAEGRGPLTAFFEEDENGAPGVSREEIARRKLVRRAHVRTILAAWVTTVPAAALLSAVIFLGLNALA